MRHYGKLRSFQDTTYTVVTLSEGRHIDKNRNSQILIRPAATWRSSIVACHVNSVGECAAHSIQKATEASEPVAQTCAAGSVACLPILTL